MRDIVILMPGHAENLAAVWTSPRVCVLGVLVVGTGHGWLPSPRSPLRRRQGVSSSLGRTSSWPTSAWWQTSPRLRPGQTAFEGPSVPSATTWSPETLRSRRPRRSRHEGGPALPSLAGARQAGGAEASAVRSAPPSPTISPPSPPSDKVFDRRGIGQRAPVCCTNLIPKDLDDEARRG